MRNTQKTVDELRPIDDTFMRKLAEDKFFCEELLRVIMNQQDIYVISNISQKDIHNVDARSVTVDILCEDGNGRQFSVEVQKANDDDHQKRVRYNGSCVQILSLKKGTRFKELPDVYMIYITEKDFLGRGRPIYHIQRMIKETGDMVDNGYYEIYVNAEIDEGTLLSDYMKLLKSSKVEDDPRFPGICSAVKYYKEGEGRGKMCEVVERYAKEYAEEMAKQTALSLICDGVSDAIIQSATKLPTEVILELRKQCEAR